MASSLSYTSTSANFFFSSLVKSGICFFCATGVNLSCSNISDATMELLEFVSKLDTTMKLLEFASKSEELVSLLS